MSGSRNRLLESSIVAIMRAYNCDQLLSAAEALLIGGTGTIEVAMTAPGALDLIGQTNRRYRGEVFFGAGSVSDAETARAAILADALSHRLCKSATE